MAEDKVYRIGEVAAELQLKTSVLRFWESEFPELVPKRSAKGHRSYNAQDVELLKRIKQLLHEQGMTIEPYSSTTSMTIWPKWLSAPGVGHALDQREAVERVGKLLGLRRSRRWRRR